MVNVLVVDDDPTVEAMFGGSSIDVGDNAGDNAGGGHEFVFAASDDAAIAVLSARDDLDIAIVAVESTVISGMDLFLKLGPKDARLPRITLSSRPDVDLLREALKRGASDFLVKPVAADTHRYMRLASSGSRSPRRKIGSWKASTRLDSLTRNSMVANDNEAPEFFNSVVMTLSSPVSTRASVTSSDMERRTETARLCSWVRRLMTSIRFSSSSTSLSRRME